MSHTMKLRERVIEWRLRQECHNTENQFSFMSRSETIDNLDIDAKSQNYLLRQNHFFFQDWVQPWQ